MAIPGQQPINIGQPNNPANSDSLYTAFNTIQNNFTALFQAASPITRIQAGNGIQISNVGTANYSITNTGVTQLIAGRNITITTLGGSPGSNGALIINSASSGNGGGGNVDSVGVISNTLVVTNSPITTSGNIDVELPAIISGGSYNNPTITVDQFGRVISAANGSGSGTVTSISVIGGSGIGVSGSPITTSGIINIVNTGVTSIVAGTGIAINQSNGAVTITNTGGGGNSGGGTVTRVSVASNTLSVTGSPIVSSGVINIELPSNISVNSITANIANLSFVNSNTVQVHASNSNSGIRLTSSSNDANAYGMNIRKSRGNSSVPTPALRGDVLLDIQAQGYTAYNKYQDSGFFKVTSNGNASNGSSFIPSIVSINSTNNTGLQYNLTLDDHGNLIVPGRISRHIYSNVTAPLIEIVSRARGEDSGNLLPVVIGDSLDRTTVNGYTGNGVVTIDDTIGYSYAGGSEINVAALPATSGAYIPSNYLIKTITTSNTINTLTFTTTGNIVAPQNVISNGSVINSSTSSVGITLTTATNTVSDRGLLSRKARGNILVPAPVQTGDVLLALHSQAYTSASIYQNSGYIDIVANGTAANSSTTVPSVVKINSTSGNGIQWTLQLDDTGNLIIPGRMSIHSYSNQAQPLTEVFSRARGVDGGNIALVQVNDSLLRTSVVGYTGNGSTNVDGINGWSYAGGTQVDVVKLPSSSGEYISSKYSIKTVSNANVILNSVFDQTGNLTIPGTFVGNGVNVTGNANVAGFETTQTVTPTTGNTQVQATIPIVINGVTYKIMLTQ